MKQPELVSFIHHYIDSHQAHFSALSDEIWDHPETRFTETHSAELLANALEQEGFAVERGVGGIETAFIASFGSGHPVIALLGEYDALAGLSQQAGCATHLRWWKTAMVTAVGITCSAPQHWPEPLRLKPGWNNNS